jgi:hypothetical protein
VRAALFIAAVTVRVPCFHEAPVGRLDFGRSGRGGHAENAEGFVGTHEGAVASQCIGGPRFQNGDIDEP